MDSIKNRMDLFKNTLFINLEHRNDRLEHATEEFKKIGIKAERVDAIKKDAGAVGCTMSHIKCLEIAKKRNYDYVFICEVNQILKYHFSKFIHKLTPPISNHF